MIAAWVVFPLLMLAVCTGCGLLLDALGGWRLPGTLLPLCGLAVVVVAVSFTTAWPSTAEASTPLMAVLAVAGWIFEGRRLRGLRLDSWAVITGLAVLVLCAAPIVISANPSFLGYEILNDSSFHLGLANLYVGHGPRTYDLHQDGFTALVGSYIPTAYPTGADVALGALSKLDGQNVAWNLQPYLAVVLAMGGVGLYELLGRVVTSRPLRAACAFVAGINGLLYALYAVASIKELVMISLLAALACLVIASVDHVQPRGLIPLLAVAASTFDVLGITAVPWVGIPLAGFALVAIWRFRPGLLRALRAPKRLHPTIHWVRLAPVVTLGGLGLAGVLIPIIQKAPTFFAAANTVLSSGDTGAGGLGYLVQPLDRWQVLGIWPDYDFRFPLYAHVDITFVMLGIAVASGGLGTLWLIRRGGWGPLVLLAGNGIAAIYLLHRSSPYAASKVLLIASAAIVLAVTMGAAALYDARRRIEAWALIAVLAAGVLWTDGLTFRYDSVAPSQKLHELATIDGRFKGQGPVLFPYGDSFANYMLRDLNPDTAYQPGVVPRAGLSVTPYQMYQLRWDTDNISQSWLDTFGLLVEDASPAFSRPPGNWNLAFHGRYYNVWRRTDRVRVLKHIGLGTYPYSSAVPSCRLITATAREAVRDGARLDYVLGSTTVTMVPARDRPPTNWAAVGGDPLELIPRQGYGTLSHEINVPRSGRYQIWLDGSYGQEFTVSVNGHQVASIVNQLGPQQQATQVATVRLRQGRNRVTLSRIAQGSLVPGQDDPNDTNREVGPLMFRLNGPDYTVSSISPGRARSLCGRSLDWLEIVR